MILARSWSKIANRSIALAFERWADAASAMQRSRLTLTRIASKIANRSVSQAFERWSDAAAELRQGLTLVHFSAQLEPCLTHKTP